MLSQIIDRIHLSTFLSTSPLQHVRIHTELLRLLELYGPSHALYQNLDGGQCEEEVLQSSSRALYRGLGHLQYMSVARASATACTNEKDVEKPGTLIRSLGSRRLQQSRISRDDGGDVDVWIWGDLAISNARKRNEEGKTYTLMARLYTRMSAAEECACCAALVALATDMRRGTDEQKKKKIEKRGWWHFSAVCVSGSWECMVYPGLLERTPVWAIWVPGEPDFPTCRLVSYIFHHLLRIVLFLS